jgi:hypothetical protein
MFKGILPSKRISSSEFIMVTPSGAQPTNGKEKENAPGFPPVSALLKPQRTTTKGLSHVFERHKEKDRKVSNEKHPPIAEVPMNEAFNQLLVSKFPSIGINRFTS